MLNYPQSIAFGGAWSLRFALTDPFNRCHHISWTGAVFELVVKDEHGTAIDELHFISDSLNAGWYSLEDYGDDVDAIVNIDVPQAQTLELEFQSAKYTLWVTYPSLLRFALIGGALSPEDVVSPTV